MSTNVAVNGDRPAPPVQPAMDPSAVVIVLMDATAADQRQSTPAQSQKGHGLDFYA